MADTHVTPLWLALDATRYLVNRGFSYQSLRVWFTGDNWQECRVNRAGCCGHLEIMFPAKPKEFANVDIEDVRLLVRERVDSALNRQIEMCL